MTDDGSTAGVDGASTRYDAPAAPGFRGGDRWSVRRRPRVAAARSQAAMGSAAKVLASW